MEGGVVSRCERPICVLRVRPSMIIGDHPGNSVPCSEPSIPKGVLGRAFDITRFVHTTIASFCITNSQRYRRRKKKNREDWNGEGEVYPERSSTYTHVRFLHHTRRLKTGRISRSNAERGDSNGTPCMGSVSKQQPPTDPFCSFLDTALHTHLQAASGMRARHRSLDNLWTLFLTCWSLNPLPQSGRAWCM